MWFLKFLFKKRFDSEFVEQLFLSLSERISDLEIVWKKGGSVVVKSDASSAMIKKGKKVLFVQNSRGGWVDLLFAGEDRQALTEVIKQYKLGQEKPNFAPGIILAVIYLLLALSSLNVNEGTVEIIYRVSIATVVLGTALMVTGYSSNWSNNVRSLCATIWIMGMIIAVPTSLLLLPLVMASNRQQLTRLYH